MRPVLVQWGTSLHIPIEIVVVVSHDLIVIAQLAQLHASLVRHTLHDIEQRLSTRPSPISEVMQCTK